MAVYALESGTILDTERAVQFWEEQQSAAKDFQAEVLYYSRKGNYWLAYTPHGGGQRTAKLVTASVAVAWLLHRKLPLPQDLLALAEDLVE
jgi:hypothetical protein